ncbi:MAG: PepSY domain-containing protein [Kofleriaceae bacterium]|nr:PepSY domain-containing protein [Kofleriaceae bacterium]
MATRLYGIVWRWHFLAGVIACPIVFVIALTGALYAFQPELDRALNPKLLVVEPTGARRPVDELVRAAPVSCTVIGINLPSAADRPATVYCTQGTRREVYIDPYRATLLGERDVGDSFFTIVFGLHWDLLLGNPGRIVIEWASSWTLLLLLSGAVLWWPRGKRGGVWRPRRDVHGRQWLRDLHAVFGAYALPVLLAVTATGLMWTLYAGEKHWHPLTEDAVHEAWDHPPRSTVRGERIATEQALAAARPANDTRAVYIALPAAPETPYTFLFYDDTFETASIASSVWVDAYASTRLLEMTWDDRSVAGKLDSVAYNVHVGAILGLPGRIAACTAALILAALCVTGPWMWWKRRPRGGLGIPPRARRTPWLLLALLAALGWLLPTVGATLVAVVLIELALWLRRMHVAARTPPGSPD